MSDTTPVILAVVGTGITLLGVLAGLLLFLFRMLRQDMAVVRQDVDSRHKDLRQDMATLHQDIKETNSRIDALRQEMRTDIAALHSRIDNLYQALFNRKDPAA